MTLLCSKYHKNREATEHKPGHSVKPTQRNVQSCDKMPEQLSLERPKSGTRQVQPTATKCWGSGMGTTLLDPALLSKETSTTEKQMWDDSINRFAK